MLRYRFIVSKLNKLTLIYGLTLLINMHYFRLGEPGKICSGDYLSGDQKNDPKQKKLFLIERGTFYMDYIIGFWITAGISVFFIVNIVR